MIIGLVSLDAVESAARVKFLLKRDIEKALGSAGDAVSMRRRDRWRGRMPMSRLLIISLGPLSRNDGAVVNAA